MAEPWFGNAPPDAPVRITLPYRVAKAVLEAIVRSGKLKAKQFEGSDRRKTLTSLAEGSRIIGDAIGAPPHRRFVYHEENDR